MAIRKVVDPEMWYFVKGEVNPADIPTRLSSSLKECFSGCWFRGPSILWSQELEVERVKAGCVEKNSLVGRVDVEVPAEVVNFSNTTEKGTPNNSRCSISAVIDCTRYSPCYVKEIVAYHRIRNAICEQFKKASGKIAW